MKKSIAVLIIIPFIIFLASCVQNELISDLCSKASVSFSEISDSVRLSDFESALSSYGKYNEKWGRKGKILSYFISHDEIDNIIIHNKRLRAYLETKNITDSLATIGELKEIYIELRDIYKVNFKNIF